MKNKLKKLINAFVFLGALNTTYTATADEPKIGISANTTLVTDYIGRPGFIIGEGPVNQTVISANYGNLTAFAWGSYDLKNNQSHEVDYGLTYIRKIDNNVTVRVSAQHWEYPSGLLGDHDDVIEPGIHYSGVIEADVTLTHLVTGHSKGGNMVHVTLAKPYPLKNITITPTFQAAYVDDFFGVSGLSQYTLGISVSKKLGSFNVEAFCKKQFGKQGLEDKVYGGISIGRNF